ncbi:MAG: hypothetical protein JWM82_4089, partial [Myxococcales bacterium]|nr:hypothetical protein [Myxococcales bacterium]
SLPMLMTRNVLPQIAPHAPKAIQARASEGVGSAGGREGAGAVM